VNSERWEEVQVSFDELVELDATERAARLASLAVRNPELHRALESLLRADAEADAHLAPLDAAFLPGSRPSDRLFAAIADRYRVEREIGSGGMATVYLARDIKHDRDVALKVLRPELVSVLGSNRFLNEIRISARLDHPHILTLIDSGAADGFLYYVMPFVRGESLRGKFKRDRQLGVDEALDITRQITSALDYAHRHGIVHRDIKPENILLHEGEAMLADFGIAVAVKEAGGNRLTESGVSLGTPQYMSPEQATGDREIDARSDIYSIAAVLYEMLAGEPPHTGASVQAVIAKLLTERPTRLRVLRDTVPESVEAAVAKALAKTPADRYATAGDFARALTAPLTGVPRRSSAAPRRWIPIVIGVGIAAAVASAAAFILAKPAPPPLPDQVQLTLSGNAISPSLSPDGTRFAFAEKQCDQIGNCTYELVIQNVDGTDRKTYTRNIGYIYKTQWTSDGRFVAFAGSHPPARHGSFAVSTLGGETRFLGCCFFDLLSGDTAYLHVGSMPGVDRSWVRRITIHDGEMIDSVPVRDSNIDYYVIGLNIPDRLIVAMGKTAESPPELRLTDLRGRVVSRITPPFGSLGRQYRARWVPSSQRLVIASQRELGGTEYDMLSMKVTASAIGPDIDTVFSGAQLGLGFYDLSPDGERLVYHAGPMVTSLSTIEVGRTLPIRVTQMPLSSTTRLRGRISPDGDRLFLARDAPRAGGHASQFSFIPRSGGAESQFPGAVENLLDFEWSPDGARIMYLYGIAGNKIRLMQRDTAGREPREIVVLPQSVGVHFQPLADGAVCFMPEKRRSIFIHRPGKQDVTLHVPDWMRIFGSISSSPDAKSLAFEAVSLSDSLVVGAVDIESRRFTRIGTFAGTDPHNIKWLEDGTLMFVFREPGGAWALYRIPPGRPAQKLGILPHKEADFSISKDGRRVAVFSYSDKNDVYMIRNFGRMLRR